MSKGQATPWRCPRGHVLGSILRDGDGINVLVLYRQAIDEGSADPQGDVDVIGVVDGMATSVYCSICHETRTWYPDRRAVQRLMQRAPVRER